MNKIDDKARASSVLPAAAKHRESMAWVLSHPQGRTFVRWLIDISGVMGYTPGNDPQAIAFNDGKRYIGVELLHRLMSKSHLEQYVILLNEGQNNV